MGIVVSVRGMPHLIDEMLGVNVRIPDGFDDVVGTSDVVLSRSCPQKAFQFVQGNWDAFFRQRDFLLQVILVMRVSVPVDRNEWFSVSRKVLR